MSQPSVAHLLTGDGLAGNTRAVQVGDLIDGRYLLDKRAGAGGMAQVFRARDQLSGERVAIKLLDVPGSSAMRRFEREVQVLSELSHPHIVGYLGHGLVRPGLPFIAMEWLNGLALDELLQLRQPTVNEAVHMARLVAQALGVAHEAGVVHRDIKPSNLYLPEGRFEQIKVLDFGIARLSDASQALTKTGYMVGTPLYMAPEQARSAREVDARADVFSLGCVLFECLHGKRPFDGPNVTAVLARILLEETPRLRDLGDRVPDALDKVVSRMMSRNPDRRPANGREVAEQLALMGELDDGPIRLSALPKS